MLQLVKETLGLDEGARLEHHGAMARFEDVPELYHACEKVRDAGFRRWDAFSPFAVHGLDKAMGLKPSRVPWVCLVTGVTGACIGFGLQWWVHAAAYPLIISGKPIGFAAWPAYVPITFELGVLFGALGAVLGWMGFNELPRWHHPLLGSKAFERVTDDGFFIVIEATDPKFEGDDTVRLLESFGAVEVELVPRQS